MNRILGRVLSGVALVVVTVASAPACVTNDQSIFVQAVLAPSTNRQQGSCTWTDDPSQPSLFEGRLDLAARDSYIAVTLIGNQMIPRGDPAATRAESNRVHINGAVVKVTLPDGEVMGEFTSSGNGFANPQANNVADFGLAMLTLIDGPTAANIAQRLSARETSKLVIANVKAFGQTLGGVDVESGEFQFPIRVCRGCLITGVNDDGKCIVDANATTAPCTAGQDELTSCASCVVRDPEVCGVFPEP